MDYSIELIYSARKNIEETLKYIIRETSFELNGMYDHLFPA